MLRRKPQICHIAAADYAAYHILLPILEGLSQDYDVTVVCSPGPDLERVAARGISVHPLPIPRSPRIEQMAVALARLTRYLRTKDFDMVHTHTPMASIISRPAARLARIPLVVYTAHGFYFHERMSPLLYRSHVALERWLGRLTDHVITVSGEDAKTAIAERIALPEQVSWIPNGIDLQRFTPADPEHWKRVSVLRSQLGIRPEQPVVGMVGRLVREKGFFEFVEAARLVADHIPDVVFMCVGGALPSDRENPEVALKRRVGQLRLDRSFLFPGFRKDVVDFLGLMNVFTLPSYREGLPLSILEAMAMGKPCVVTNIRGCRELIVDGKFGRVIEPGDIGGLASAIADLLRIPEQAANMGSAARKHVEEHYSLQICLERYVALYRRLLKVDGAVRA